MNKTKTKNLLKRSELWLCLFILGALADEYIKEGYIFKLEDVYNLMFTHEKLIVLAIVLLATTTIYRHKIKPENGVA